tara:strand:- start:536 stop:745 length:210 start_codon:yes stop_codon:yes gene_type:complete
MSDELKMHCVHFVDQLNVKNKGKLLANIYQHFLYDQFMNKEQETKDPFTDESAVEVINTPPEECESCSA